MKKMSVQSVEAIVYETIDNADNYKLENIYNFIFGKNIRYNEEEDVFEVEE